MEQKEFDQVREFCLSLRRNVTSQLDYEYRMAVLIEKCARELHAAQQSVQRTVEWRCSSCLDNNPEDKNWCGRCGQPSR